MSKRLIYEEDAIEWVENILEVDKYYHPHAKSRNVPIDEVIDRLKRVPSAQPQRMKGRWINVTKTGGAELWKCSECGELELEDSYFCPSCGADMRGDEDAAD